MSTTVSKFSESSQRAILWWGIVLAIIYGLALWLCFDMVPPKDPEWSSAQVASWYAENNTQIKWGAVIGGWTGAFMVPILAVVAVQMARVETGGAKIWSAMGLISGGLMSIPLMLPPLFWGVAAYTKDRVSPDATTIMHELGNLTLVTTDQFYVFLWVGVSVICFRPATALVPHNPFPRWWGYLSLWITLMFEAGAFAFLPRTGPLAWDGLLVFWSPLSLFGVWISIQSFLIFRALRGQAAAKTADDSDREAPTVEVM